MELACFGPETTAHTSGYTLPATTTYYVLVIVDSGSSLGGYDARVKVQRGFEPQADAGGAEPVTKQACSVITLLALASAGSRTPLGTLPGANASRLRGVESRECRNVNHAEAAACEPEGASYRSREPQQAQTRKRQVVRHALLESSPAFCLELFWPEIQCGCTDILRIRV